MTVIAGSMALKKSATRSSSRSRSSRRVRFEGAFAGHPTSPEDHRASQGLGCWSSEGRVLGATKMGFGPARFPRARISRGARVPRRDHPHSRRVGPRGSRARPLLPEQFPRVRVYERCGSRTLAGPARVPRDSPALQFLRAWSRASPVPPVPWSRAVPARLISSRASRCRPCWSPPSKWWSPALSPQSSFPRRSRVSHTARQKWSRAFPRSRAHAGRNGPARPHLSRNLGKFPPGTIRQLWVFSRPKSAPSRIRTSAPGSSSVWTFCPMLLRRSFINGSCPLYLRDCVIA